MRPRSLVAVPVGGRPPARVRMVVLADVLGAACDRPPLIRPSKATTHESATRHRSDVVDGQGARTRKNYAGQKASPHDRCRRRSAAEGIAERAVVLARALDFVRLETAARLGKLRELERAREVRAPRRAGREIKRRTRIVARRLVRRTPIRRPSERCCPTHSSHSVRSSPCLE